MKEYFSHDYTTRLDDKIKKLIRKHGMLGYGSYWSIIEDLYNNANALRTDYDGIAYDLRIDESVVKSIINDFDLFTIDDDYFGSVSVGRRIEERNAKSKKARESALSRWKKKEDDANALRSDSDSNAIKGNKIKEKERIEKESKVNNSILLSQVDESTLDHADKEYYEVAFAFWELIKSNLLELNISIDGINKAEYKKWTDPIRLLMETDKQSINEIREVFTFLRDDEFWKQQIRSTAKLRKKDKEGIKYFEKLLIKSRDEQRKQHTSKNQKSGVSENYKNSILERLLDPGGSEEV